MTQKKSRAHSEPKRDDAMRDSFPASDPPADPTAQGTRAVPVADMKAGTAPEPDDAIRLSASFADMEAAKLALEALVREGPVPREHVDIETGSAGVTLSLRVPPGDRDRIRAMLDRETARA